MNNLFYFIIIDRTRKLFSISEPIWDDTWLVHRVCELHINAYHAPVIEGKKEELIQFHQDDGFELVETDIILDF